MNLSEVYRAKPNKEWVELQERSHTALLKYEISCILKYDRPFPQPSRVPKKGDRMVDFAQKYGTTIQEMKKHWRSVEYELEVKFGVKLHQKIKTR